jgi:adenylate kinase
MIIIFFGPPGSGKGTQSHFLIGDNSKHVSTGDLIREEIARNGELSKVFSDLTKQGKLIDDQYIIQLIENVIKNHKEKTLIFDGFPRTLKQAEAFDVLLEKNSLKVDIFIYFDVSFEELSNRILGRFSCAQCAFVFHETTRPTKIPGQCDHCGGHVFQKRPDDSLEVLEKRYSIYMQEAEKVREHYKNCLVIIDASKDFESVRKSVDSALQERKAK